MERELFSQGKSLEGFVQMIYFSPFAEDLDIYEDGLANQYKTRCDNYIQRVYC